MDQTPNTDPARTSKANDSAPPGGQRPPSPDPRVESEQAAACAAPRSGLVRLSEGTVASASDETLSGIITEAKALAREGEEELQRRADTREADFLEMVRQRALVLRVTPARLAAAVAGKPVPRTRASGNGDGRSMVAAKYRDPQDPTRTWSGRGNPPDWIAFGDEVNPETGKPLPLRKFWISEQDK